MPALQGKCLLQASREMNQMKTDNMPSAQNAKTLLYVVDDEPVLLELAGTLLEAAGYAVIAFRDPESALQAFTAADPPPALIVTDYAMHHMTGLDLIRECRRIRPKQKCLLVSGTVDESVSRDVKERPDRFLAKPYQGKQLIGLVQSVLVT